MAIHWSKTDSQIDGHNTSSDHIQSVIKSTQLPPDLMPSEHEDDNIPTAGHSMQ